MNACGSARSWFSVRTHPRWEGFRAGACLAALFCLHCLGQQPTSNPTAGTFRPDKAIAVSPVNVRPDANQLLEINVRRMQLQKFDAANAARKRQLTQDSERLLQIAAELNAELTGAANQGSSVAAATKADMIEQLAHAVKEKMKLAVAAQ